MSFLPISEENKEAPVGQTTNAPGGAPPPQTSGSAGAAPDAPKGASAGSPTQFGSSASKLGDYLSANAPQITQQAENITGQLNQRYGDVSQGITNAANQFGQQVQGGYAAPNQDLVSQAVQNPTGFVADPGNIEAFRKQYNNDYTGPLNFEGTSPYSDIQGQVGQAVQQGNLLGSQAGLQTYLQGQGTNPNRASATLDALLLRGNPEAQASIRGAAGQLGTLGGKLQTATEGANALVPQAQQKAQQSKESTQSAINQYLQGFGNELQQGLTGAENQRDALNTQLFSIQQKLANNQPLTDQEAQAIGLNTADIGKLLDSRNMFAKNWGVSLPSLGNYFSYDPIINPPTLAGASTPQQFQTDQALKALLGDVYNPQFTPDQESQIGNLQGMKLPQTTTPEMAWNLLNALQKGSDRVDITGKAQSWNNDWDSLASMINDPRFIAGNYTQEDLGLFNKPLQPLTPV